MAIKKEEVDVRYCDICGAKQGIEHSMSSCWKCGKDICARHHHLVSVEGGIEHQFTYLCTPDRDEMEAKLKVLFQDFSIAHSTKE